MGSPLSLIKGWAGKPSHPPLTDASIGAYTVGVAMLVAGHSGWRRSRWRTGPCSRSAAACLGPAPALTGLLDWLGMERGTPWRNTATIHLFTMLTATVLFALTFLAHLDGYDDGVIETLPLVLGLGALASLTRRLHRRDARLRLRRQGPEARGHPTGHRPAAGGADPGNRIRPI